MKSVLYTTIAFSFALMVFASSNLTLVVDDNGITIAPTQAVAFGGGGGDDCNCDDDDDEPTPAPTPTPSPSPKPMPVCKSFTAAPTSLSYGGGKTTLKWQTANATKVTISSIGEVNLNNSDGRTADVVKTQTFTLTATNSEGSDTCTAKVTVAAAPLPVCNSFTITPTTITAGESVTFTWTSTKGNSATINQGIGSVPLNGTKSIKPTQTTSYTLTIIGVDGTKATCPAKTVTVKAPVAAPVCNSFTASASSIKKGQSATLNWTTTNATVVTINQGIGSVAVDGSKSVAPTQTTTYTLTAKNSAGVQVTCARTITVTDVPAPAPDCISFTASPSTINKGQKSTLSWSTANATQIILTSPGPDGNMHEIDVTNASSWQVGPDITWTFTLTVKGANGQSDTCTRTVTVNDVVYEAPTCTLEVSPSTINRGSSAVLVWSTHNADSVTFNQGIGSVAMNSSLSVSPTETTTYTLTATGPGGTVTCSKTVTVNTPPPDAPTCVLYASPTSVPQGGSSRLTWTSTNTSGTAYISNLALTVDPRDFNAYVTASNIQDDQSYTMTVHNSAGVEATCSVTVEVEEEEEDDLTCEDNVLDFYATDDSIDEGDSTTLIWNTRGLTSISINNGVNIDSNDFEGSDTVSPDSDTTYTLTGSNGSDSISCPVHVDVDEDDDDDDNDSPSPRCELKISDKSINLGDRITLEWETSNATFVELEDSTGKILSTTDGKSSSDKDEYYDGEITLSPTKDTTYTLTAEKGSKDKECKVSVDVDDDIVVLENRDQQPLVTGISLTQVPYTGFEAGPFLTTLFYGLLLLWALYLAYVIVIRRSEGTVAFSRVAVDSTPMITSEKINATMFAPATITTPRFVEPVVASAIAPVVGYASRDTVQDTIATEIENQAHVARVLFSSDALRTLMSTTTEANRTEVVKSVITHATSSYPSEDGWVVVNEERMKVACATCVAAAIPSAFTPSSVSAGNSSLAEAIVSGNIVAAYQLIGNRPMIALADAAADLDALYRIKQGGTATISAYLATAEVDTTKLQAAISALTGAIDGTYTDEASAVKMAIMKATKALS